MRICLEYCKFMNSSNCVTCSCIAGVAALTFIRCRGSDAPGRQTFTISSCQAGQVISIGSAEVGYDRLLNPRTTPPCSWQHATCRRSVANNAAIMRCNGQRSCSFTGAIFIYPRGSVPQLCDDPKDGNYITIKYECIAGK